MADVVPLAPTAPAPVPLQFEDGDDFVFGASDDEMDEDEASPQAAPPLSAPPAAPKSPLLSADPLPAVRLAANFDSRPSSAMQQFRSPQINSPTFSDASTTVSPREVFGDDQIMKKSYSSLFASAGPSKMGSSAPISREYTNDREATMPSFERPPYHHDSMDSSQNSYLSTSSEEDEPASPLVLPEPSFSHGRRTSFGGTGARLSPRSNLVNSPRRIAQPLPTSMGPPAPPMHLGFAPIQPLQAADREEDFADVIAVGGPVESVAEGVGRVDLGESSTSPETKPAAADRKRTSPFDDEGEGERQMCQSSASDSDADEDWSNNGPNRKPPSSASRPRTSGGSKSKKARPSAPQERGPSVALSSRTSETPSEICTFLDPSTGAMCGRRFVRYYDLKRHEDSTHPKGNVAPTGWYCEACGKQFSRKDALLRHNKTIIDCASGNARQPNKKK